MSVVVIARPAPIISLERAKSHLRVDFADDDAQIMAFITSAQKHIDGPGGILGRAVGVQTLEVSLHGGRLRRGCGVDLPYPPYVDLVALTYVDLRGDEQILLDADVRATVESGSTSLLPARGTAWPSVLADVDAVRIRYRAGYQAPEDEAAPLITAMLMMIGHWYANREAVNVGNIVNTFPMAVDALLSPYRLVRV